MYVFFNSNTDPFFNLALEEVLLKNSCDDFFILYVNSPSVIIGKHQVAYAEVNFRFIHENNIPLIRRISGGGAVYHDHGNINYSFILNGEREKLVDFNKHTLPVIDFLKIKNTKAYLEGKSNLRVDGLKFSGNSAHLYKNRVIHHGTILLDSDTEKLSNSLKVIPNTYSHKAVHSVRTSVVNINTFLKTDVNSFVSEFIEYIRSVFPNSEYYRLSQEIISKTEVLVNEKYKTFDWNIAYSPKYTFINIPEQIRMEIENGIIINCTMEGNLKCTFPENFFIGLPHDYESILKKIHSLLDINTSMGITYKLF